MAPTPCKPGFCLDCGTPIVGVWSHKEHRFPTRCSRHERILRLAQAAPARQARVGSLADEVAEVGVDEFCRRRYERPDGVPEILLRRLRFTPIVPEYAPESVMRCTMTATLTPSRLRALELVAQGYTNREIAVELGVSATASTDYVKCAMAVLHARNRCHAVHLAHEAGLLSDVAPGKPRLVANHNKARGWTAQRVEALRLSAEGYSQKQITKRMGGSNLSSRDCLRAVHHLLGATRAANAIHRAHLAGMLGSEPILTA